MQPSALVVGLHGISRHFFQAVVSASKCRSINSSTAYWLKAINVQVHFNPAGDWGSPRHDDPLHSVRGCFSISFNSKQLDQLPIQLFYLLCVYTS